MRSKKKKKTETEGNIVRSGKAIRSRILSVVCGAANDFYINQNTTYVHLILIRKHFFYTFSMAALSTDTDFCHMRAS